jgi:NAD(P)-dependent dehydrogenase (short-subunit alcohol dehydrogenase family)
VQLIWAQIDGMARQYDVVLDPGEPPDPVPLATCHHGPSFEVTAAQWDDVFDLNVRALWKTSLAVGAVMRDRRSGSIVNIASMSGIIVNRPQWQPTYNASRAAVHHLMKSLAVVWAPYGIRVNAVAPGYVRTDMAPVDRPEFPPPLDRGRPAAALRRAE